MKVWHLGCLIIALAVLWGVGLLLGFKNEYVLSVCGVIAFGVIAYMEGHDALRGEGENREGEKRV
ncbi:MAG: hypothetical protein NUV60_00130 [Patescibacteria group bacterium]|nr:hypothetical protein [Patescibacteria group bacterium]